MTTPTLSDLVAESIAIRPLAPRTRESYEDILALHIIPRWGDTPVDAVSYRELQKWLTGIAQTAPYLAHRIHVVIRQALRLAVIDDLVTKNVADYVKLGTPVRKSVSVLKPAEVRALCAAMPTQRDLLMVQVMAIGGLRFGEVIALTPDSVTDTGLHVSRSITAARGGGWHVQPVKNHQERDVHLPGFLVSDLRKYADDRHNVELLFASRTGTPIHLGNWSTRILKPACREAGIPPISPHVLRHTAATTALHGGVPAHVVARHLGHQDASVTLAFYAGTWEAQLADCASVVGAALGGATTNG